MRVLAKMIAGVGYGSLGRRARGTLRAYLRGRAECPGANSPPLRLQRTCPTPMMPFRITQLALLTALAVSAPPLPSPPVNSVSSAGRAPNAEAREQAQDQAQPAGQVAWFEGSFDAALALAAAESRPLFLDFWADWCQPCRRLEITTFADPAVAALTARMVALRVDADGELGEQLSLRFGVRMLPAMVFLNAQGEPEDALEGYRDAAAFGAELQRILRGERTVTDLERRAADAPSEPLPRFELLELLDRVGAEDRAAAQADELRQRFASAAALPGESLPWRDELRRRFLGIGDESSAALQLDAMRRLDPGARSLELHRVAMEPHVAVLRLEFKGEPLRAFLENESHPELLYEGWNWLALLSFTLAERAEAGEDPLAARAAARSGADAYAALWPHVPADERTDVARTIGERLYARRADLTPEQLGFMLTVAQRAAAAPGASAPNGEPLALLALCLAANGDAAQATLTAQRALRADPENAQLRARLATLLAED